MQVKKNAAKSKSKKNIEKKGASENKKYSVVLPGFILLLTLLAYLPVLNAGFVNWDDPDYVLNNSFIRSFSGINDILTKPIQGNYHPLTMLSLALNYSVSGLNAGSYHVVNLVIHLLNTLLVFKLASRLSNQNNFIAFTTALLFGIHPMHVESVAWIAERKDVLYAFFFLLGLISYLKYIDAKSKSAYLFSIFWFLLSLASKPAAVIFPIALFTFDFFRKRTFSFKLIIEKIPFLVFALVLGYFTLQGQKAAGATDTIESFSLDSRILFAFYGFLMYVIRFIAPLELGAFHPFPPVNESLPLIYFLSPLFFIAVMIVCLKTYKKYPVVVFGFSFYLINLLLVLQFLIVGSAIIAERYTYIPYIGLFFLFGWLLERKFRNKLSVGYGVMIGIGIIFAFISNVQAGTWKNSLTLWKQVLKHNSSSALAYENLARHYREDLKDYNKALENFNEALKHERYKAIVYKSIGKTYFDIGNNTQNADERRRSHQLAVENFNQALFHDSVNNHPDKKVTGEIYINRGSVLASSGLLEEALRDFNTGLQWDSLNRTGYLNRGLYYLTKGDYAKAIEEDSRYLKLNPFDADIYSERGVSKRYMRRYEESLVDLNKAISLKNTVPLFFLERARTFRALGNHAAAKEDARRAQAMGIAVEPELLQ